MTIYIPQFVLGIIATVVVELGICMLVGIVSSKKEVNNKKTNPSDSTEHETTESSKE